MRRRSTWQMHPHQLGCMLAVLTTAAIAWAVLGWIVAHALFSWRLG